MRETAYRLTHSTVNADALAQAQEKWKSLFSQATTITETTKQETVLSKANSRTNNPWGDILGEKEPGITRVYVTNINGMQLDGRGGKFDSICRSLKEVQADVFCGQEHNVDTTQPHLRKIVFDTAKQHWERHRLTIATSPITYKTPYKPGGTIMITTGSLTGRLYKQARDKWGRWTSQEFLGQEGRRLVIISAYQPIVNGNHAGKITVAAQQHSLLIQSADETTNPRVAFRRDLAKCVAKYILEKYDILLTGDFNEQFGADPDGMVKLATQFELLDVMASRHSSKEPATYARGTKRLDFALATAAVCNALNSAGYEPFNNRIASDHRGYFFDFTTAELFGSATQTLATRANRQLSSRNTKQVTAYIRRKYEILNQCNAFERADKLSLPGNRHSFAERLDADVLQASLTAEKDLPPIGEPAWSVALAKARRKVLVLSKHLTALKTRLDHTQIIRDEDVLLLFDKSFQWPRTQRECSKALREEKSEVKRIVKESTARRDDELRQKLKDLDQSTATADKTLAVQLRRLKKAEDLKNLFRKIKSVRTKQVRRGVTRVEIPRNADDNLQTCTDWKQVDVPSEILELLQTRNRTHFGQALGTPFTIEPLATQLGFSGCTQSGQQILDGTYDSTALHPHVQLLIKYLKQVHDIQQDPTRPTISAQEFESKLRVWTESTTTSPSGVHLGHYKALIARHSFSSDTPDADLSPEFQAQREEVNFKQRELFRLHHVLINYALERGYSYRRWQTVANTILFKDPDNVRLHRTRVIHLYEADYNLALGIKWRAAMHIAEDRKALNEGQYGSRSNRCATDPVLIEELQYEISRATRKPVILTNYDATACYDRIIPNLGMLVSRKYGVPSQVTSSNATTLETAEYKIRTELGLASTGYRHTATQPVYGTGQGSSNSPAIWCFLSSTLFDCYDQVSRPATYSTADNQTTVNLGMIGFVDDCNGQTNSFHSDGTHATVRQLLTQTQHNAQQWNDLLSASGGALELSKCSCHILEWKFTLQGAPILVPSHEYLQSQMSVQDRQHNKSQSLQLLSAYKAHKTLGHYKEPMGNQAEQFRQLKNKSDESTAFLWTCPLTRLEAWTYYYACYLPSVGYPLACSTLTKKQLDTIQRKAMSIIVARCGFNRNTRKEILYGPLELGGANFRSLYLQQGVGQVTTFIKHWRSRSHAGKLLRVALSWFQQQVGVSFSILENVKAPLPHLESKWINSLRQFLAETGMSLNVDEPSIPARQRKFDVFLMDLILESEAYTPAEVCKLNYCRLYLQAVTISDLAVVEGNRLDPVKMQGHFAATSSTTHGTTIHQERPSETAWQLWRRMCRHLMCDRQGKLNEPLEDWLLPATSQRQQHQAYWEAEYLCESDHILWVRQMDIYIRCVKTTSPLVYHETPHSCQWYDLPICAQPTEIVFLGHGAWRLDYVTPILTETALTATATFDRYVLSLNPWEAELLHYIDMPSDPFSVSDSLVHGLKAVSDGSVWSDNQGAYGWIISTSTGDRLAKGKGPARGAKVDSYRAEAYGMLTILCFLRRLTEFTQQHDQWTGTLATDSQSLLETITVPQTGEFEHLPLYRKRKSLQQLDVNCPEWDLLSSILVELSRWPGLHLKHVRGHQDRDIAYEQLPLLAQLNVDADDMASQYQSEEGMARTDVLLTETAGVHLVTPEGTRTSHYETAIRYQATKPALYQHLKEKHGWSAYTMGVINWKAHGACLRKHMKRRTHYTKLVHDILPTCKRLFRGDHIRGLCPSCQQHLEDWNHIVKCPHPTRVEWRESMLLAIEERCRSLGTNPTLRKVLMDALGKWLTTDSETFTLDPSSHPQTVRRLIGQQNAIGWHQVFLGRFGYEWHDLQDNYYEQQHQQGDRKKRRKMTGHRWQVALISTIWDQWWAVWQSRNEALHGADAQARAKAESREVHRTLHELYSLRAQVDPEIQAVFHSSINDQLAHPTWFNQNWIAVHGPIIRENLKQATARAKAGMRSIRQYFGATVQHVSK